MKNIQFAELFGIRLDSNKGKVKIELTNFQKNVLNKLDKKLSDTIIENSRQTGVSTTLALHIANFLISNDGEKNILLIKTPNLDASHHLLDKVRLILSQFNFTENDFYDNIRNNFLMVRSNTVKVISSCDSLRGGEIPHIHSLIIDNAVYCSKLDKFIKEFKSLDINLEDIKLVIASTGCGQEKVINQTIKMKKMTISDSDFNRNKDLRDSIYTLKSLLNKVAYYGNALGVTSNSTNEIGLSVSEEKAIRELIISATKQLK